MRVRIRLFLVVLTTLAAATESRAGIINTTNQISIASSNPFPGTSGTHFHSSVGQAVEVGSFSSSEEGRGVAEFNTTGQAASALTTLFFTYTGPGGYFGQTGPGNYGIQVVAYAGDNVMALSDYTAPSLGVIGSFSTSGLVAGSIFSFDVTSAFNATLGGNSLGIRLQPTSNPGTNVSTLYSNFRLETADSVVPEPASMALLCMGGGVLAFGRKKLRRKTTELGA